MELGNVQCRQVSNGKAVKMRRMSDSEIFWKYVKRGEPNACWEWFGFRKPTGYGANPAMSEARAHRMSWALHFGPIPEGKWVLHRCDNPPCFNPEHLFIGDPRINAHDRDAKGRQRTVKGDDSPHSKITEEQASQIFPLSEQGLSAVEISKIVPLSPTQIKRILRGESRKGLSEK